MLPAKLAHLALPVPPVLLVPQVPLALQERQGTRGPLQFEWCARIAIRQPAPGNVNKAKTC